MSTVDIGLVVVAAAFVLVAGLFSSADAALSSFSKARAEQIGSSSGSARVLVIVGDAPRYLNTALFLRMLTETAAIILVTVVMLDVFVTGGGSGSGPETDRSRWLAMLASLAVMLVVSFVVIGVAPRTLGRQHSERIALLCSGPLIAFTKVLGPLPRLLILVGNAITPGRGFSEGPFASEAELRELVDIAEQSELIEAGEREMIHSVFELGDTLVREVMVPRTTLVSTEAGTTLRSAMSLFLRSGFSRVPVVGEGLDDVRGILYLKDVARRLHEDPAHGPGEVVDAVMREAHFVPDSKPADDLLRDMQRSANHVAIVVDEYGGTAGMVTLEDLVEEIVGEIADEYDHEEPDVEKLGDDLYRVPSRLHVEDLGELFGLELEDEEVDTVGGLLAKALGRVPIAGATAEVDGLVLTAERFEGRRNQLATVLVHRVAPVEDAEPAEQDRVPAS
jgi:CBS domain containing-hemolysin-like protein